jgi:hypothetical protein
MLSGSFKQNEEKKKGIIRRTEIIEREIKNRMKKGKTTKRRKEREIKKRKEGGLKI